MSMYISVTLPLLQLSNTWARLVLVATTPPPPPPQCLFLTVADQDGHGTASTMMWHRYSISQNGQCKSNIPNAPRKG